MTPVPEAHDQGSLFAPPASSNTAANLVETQFAGATPVCWSYGMGAESTAGVVRTLLDSGFRPRELAPDLSNLWTAWPVLSTF